eukprot:5932853-Amphidinium_carterae.1
MQKLEVVGIVAAADRTHCKALGHVDIVYGWCQDLAGASSLVMFRQCMRSGICKDFLETCRIVERFNGLTQP